MLVCRPPTSVEGLPRGWRQAARRPAQTTAYSCSRPLLLCRRPSTMGIALAICRSLLRSG